MQAEYLIRQHGVFLLLKDVLYSVVELGVANTGTVQPREQVCDQPQKQRHVLKHKLWQVHVS